MPTDKYSYKTYETSPLLGTKRYYFDFIDPDGVRIMSSQPFSNAAQRDNAITKIKRNSLLARVVTK